MSLLLPPLLLLRIDNLFHSLLLLPLEMFVDLPSHGSMYTVSYGAEKAEDNDQYPDAESATTIPALARSAPVALSLAQAGSCLGRIHAGAQHEDGRK